MGADTIPAPSQLDPANPASSLGFLLGKVHRAARREWETSLADLSLTAPQAALLRAIAASPGQGVRDLARSMSTDPMNVWRLVETLAGRALVVSEADPEDRRRRRLELTKEGETLAAEVAHRAGEQERALVRKLGHQTYDALVHGLLVLDSQLDTPSARVRGLEARGHGPR